MEKISGSIQPQTTGSVEPDAPSVQKHGFTFSGGKIFFRGKQNRIQEEDPLIYERSLEKRIKRTKARIALIKDKIRRTEEAASDIHHALLLVRKSSTGKKILSLLQEKDWMTGMKNGTLPDAASLTFLEELLPRMGIFCVNTMRRIIRWK